MSGILAHYRQCPSPHFNLRPVEVDSIVIHNISLPAGCFGEPYVEDLFLGCLDCSVDASFADLQGVEVSSHFFIDRQGRVTQFVDCDKRAWHAGVSSLFGRENCNDFSIGIELEGVDDIAYESSQYTVLRQLCIELMQRYPAISTERIIGHSDIAPGRKTDPGPAFDWPMLKSALTSPVAAEANKLNASLSDGHG